MVSRCIQGFFHTHKIKIIMVIIIMNTKSISKNSQTFAKIVEYKVVTI